VKSHHDLNFKVAAVGGTFDLLHKGHRQLLETAFKVGDRVVIGLTEDSFVKRLHKPHKVEDYAIRESELRKFLNDRSLLSKAEIVPLRDRYGPSVNDGEIEALIVSRRSELYSNQINKIRRSKGLQPLEIVSIDMVLAQDRVPISTTRIRRGRIDREGTLLGQN
jgi:cytidyltransferase-like protein